MLWSVMAGNVNWCHVTKPYTKPRWRWLNIRVARLQGQMNSKTRAKTDPEDIRKEIKKTAIVKPTIRPKQNSFNGFTHGSARIKKEESFSSLPSEIQSKSRRVHKNRKLNIFSHDKNNIRKFQHKVNKSEIRQTSKKYRFPMVCPMDFCGAGFCSSTGDV